MYPIVVEGHPGVLEYRDPESEALGLQPEVQIDVAGRARLGPRTVGDRPAECVVDPARLKGVDQRRDGVNQTVERFGHGGSAR